MKSVLYDEQARQAALAQMGEEILCGARNELYLNLRFLDVALSSLRFAPDTEISPAGTDGALLYFHPDALSRLYLHGREAVNRLYLHGILHCLLAHPFLAGNRDRSYWDLACDIAVEHVMDQLPLRAVHRPKSALRREMYRILSAPEAAGTGDTPQTGEVPGADAANSDRTALHSGRDMTHPGSAAFHSGKDTAHSDRAVLHPGADAANSDRTVLHPSADTAHSDRTALHSDLVSGIDTLHSGATSGGDTAHMFTAQRIYHRLCRLSLSDERLDALQREFRSDDHHPWEQTGSRKAPCPQQQHWEDIRDRMQTELELFGKEAEASMRQLSEVVCSTGKRRHDYREFLRKFSVLKEEIQVDPDSFDYIFYHYGMELYGNLPLIEPLETREVRKVEDFVIVLDTSMSCKGDLLLHFLEETYDILSESESFFRKIHLHILQCDDQVREDVLITNHREMKDYLENFTVRGFGGTDFRPPFARVAELMQRKCFTRLRGLIYFTDGYGIFPLKKPPYETAFVFLKEDYRDVDVPPWAIKLIVDREEIMGNADSFNAFGAP